MPKDLAPGWKRSAEELPKDGDAVVMHWILTDRVENGWYEKGNWMSQGRDWILGAPEFWRHA